MSVLRTIWEAIGAADKLRQLVNETITLIAIASVAIAYGGISKRTAILEAEKNSVIEFYENGELTTYRLAPGAKAEIRLNGKLYGSVLAISEVTEVESLIIDYESLETDEGD